jgi:hypothetical protein
MRILDIKLDRIFTPFDAQFNAVQTLLRHSIAILIFLLYLRCFKIGQELKLSKTRGLKYRFLYPLANSDLLNYIV